MSANTSKLNDLRIERAPERRSVFPALFLFLLIAGGAAGGGYYWYNRPQALAVTTARVEEQVSGGAQTLLNASGYVIARREATVSSKVSGKVVEVLVEEGMRVEEDQVLARLDASNVETSFNLSEASMNAAKVAIEETRANLKRANLDLQRFSRMVAESIASQSELDQATADAKALQARLARQTAEVAVAERQVAVWQQELEDRVIRAPFGGIVTAKNAQPGEMISPMSAGGGFTRTGICTIVDMESLEIEVDVSESYINRVEAGLPVEATLDAYPQWRIPARVIAIIPTADRQKATVRVRVGFEALDPRILPQMSVKVAFQSGSEADVPETRVVTIPADALQRRGDQDVVFVVSGDTVERRAVKVDGVRSSVASIASGVSPGERVVVDAPETLEEGIKIMEKDE